MALRSFEGTKGENNEYMTFGKNPSPPAQAVPGGERKLVLEFFFSPFPPFSLTRGLAPRSKEDKR